MAYPTIGLKAILDMGSFDQAQSKYVSSVDQMTTQTESTSGRIVSAFKAIAGAAVLWKGAAMVADLAALGAQAERTGKTFDTLVGGQMTSALEKLRTATKGTITDMDLMAASSQLLIMGIAGTTDEAIKMTEVASQLAMAMG